MINRGQKPKGPGGKKSVSKKSFKNHKNKEKDDSSTGFSRTAKKNFKTRQKRKVLLKEKAKQKKDNLKKERAEQNSVKKDFNNSQKVTGGSDQKSRSFPKKDQKDFGKKSDFKGGKPPIPTKVFSNPDKDGAEEEKPDWNEYKKQNKELKEKRKAKKLEENYDMVIEVKKIGEKLRRANLQKDMQEKLTKKFHELAQNHYSKLIFTHDISRIIQWQLKYCSDDIRLAIVTELKPHIKTMFTSNYAKNILKTLLKVGSSFVKKSILEACYGNVLKLISNNVSCALFEKIYVEVASNDEKFLLKQEFYSDIYKKSKDKNIKTLSDIYLKAPEMKSGILSSVKANLTKILNKNLINSTLVHSALYEYLSECNAEDRTEINALIRPLIAELSQTKNGAKAGILCIWHGNNKDRKLIMKTLKEHVKDIMTSEHGHLMIIALLDCVDDTVLLKKILLQEVLSNLNEIILNEYGRLVILYIVARRDTHYFHPTLIEYLKQGDGNAASKKPADIREKELLENVIDNLLENVTNDIKTWLSTGPLQWTTLAVLKASSGDKPKSAFEVISKFLTDPDSKLQKDDKTFDAIEESGFHLILKKLIQMDSKRAQNNEVTFGQILLEYLSPEVIERWINCNRGCYILVTLIENESEEIVSKLKSKLKKISSLASKTTKGAAILIQKIK